MIPKVIRHGTSFQGALSYVLREDHKPTILGRHDVAGSTPDELAYSFGFSRGQRPEVSNPVLHLSISYHAADAAVLDRGQREAVVQSLVHHLVTSEATRRNIELDPQQFQWVAVSHQDKAHPHDHLIMSRIGLDGSLFYGENDGRAARAFADAFEVANPHLVPARGVDRLPGHHPPVGDSVIDRTGKEAADRGVPLVRNQVAMVIHESLSDLAADRRPVTESALRERLAAHGYLLAVTHLPSGDRRGVTVGVEDPHHPGAVATLPDGTALRWSGAQLGFRGPQALHRQFDAADHEATSMRAVSGPSSPVPPAETAGGHSAPAQSAPMVAAPVSPVAPVDGHVPAQAAPRVPAEPRSPEPLPLAPAWEEIRVAAGASDVLEASRYSGRTLSIAMPPQLDLNQLLQRCADWQGRQRGNPGGREDLEPPMNGEPAFAMAGFEAVAGMRAADYEDVSNIVPCDSRPLRYRHAHLCFADGTFQTGLWTRGGARGGAVRHGLTTWWGADRKRTRWGGFRDGKPHGEHRLFAAGRAVQSLFFQQGTQTAMIDWIARQQAYQQERQAQRIRDEADRQRGQDPWRPRGPRR